MIPRFRIDSAAMAKAQGTCSQQTALAPSLTESSGKLRLVIRKAHAMFYSSDAKATREFLRDVLELPAHDIGDEWLIFDMPSAEIGVHPSGEGSSPAGTHDVSFVCDDIHGTVAMLSSKGVNFLQEVEDHGYGWVTYLKIPGEVTVQLYEPKYQLGC